VIFCAIPCKDFIRLFNFELQLVSIPLQLKPSTHEKNITRGSHYAIYVCHGTN